MITICRRKYGTDKFRWFYHPMLPQNERDNFHFFVWIGKQWCIAWQRRKMMKQYEKEQRCKEKYGNCT